MHIGKTYKLTEFIRWTRRKIYILAVVSTVPVVLYQALGFKWMAVPWPVVGVLGTATSFIVGFKNSHAYTRMREALAVWARIQAVSRFWAMICRDYPVDQVRSKILLHRHFAWVTALRYQLRSARVWENSTNPEKGEYLRRFLRVPEHEIPLDVELRKYLSVDEISRMDAMSNKAAQLIYNQSEMLRELYTEGCLATLHYSEMQKVLRECIEHQSVAEGLKNSPYPSQYAIVNRIFVWSFVALLPLGLIGGFDGLNSSAGTSFAGHMCWFTVPFSLFISWLYISLDQVSQSTENPFEGGANDVPMAHICLLMEIELKQMSGEVDLPEMLPRNHDILL